MKKLFILVGVLILSASTSSAQSLTLDQILESHYKAVGIDKLQNVKTIIMSGSITTHVVMPTKTYRVRPNKFRMERDINDITGLTVYDGQNAWSTAPWSRTNPKPQITGTALNDLIARSDFDGVIYNWKDKGHKAELIGVEKAGELDVFRIKLVRKDGAIEYFIIDCKSFLLLKKLSYQMAKDKEVEIENDFSDYRSVDGIMFAFVNDNLMGGQLASSIQYDTIELNQPVDENLFVMPIK
jgi:outer membrane lipoprotein-sorting protein